jgi:predicted Zn finger-like uncharacterized protein
MLLACPHCATIYDVSRGVIGTNGRSLRCARCQTVWFATRSQELLIGPPPAADSSATKPSQPTATDNPLVSSTDAAVEIEREQAASVSAVVLPSPAPAAPTANAAAPPAQGEDIETFARRRAQEEAHRAGGLRGQLGPPAIIAALAVVVSLLLAWRTPIVQHAPQLASFYAAIGLPVNLRQLVFREIKTSNEMRDGVPVLLIEGVIASIARAPVEVPRLRLALRDAARQEIFSWTATPEQSTLQPGATLPFRSQLASPPDQGHDVVVRFLNQRDATEGGR